jgi:hypothetical protein
MWVLEWGVVMLAVCGVVYLGWKYRATLTDVVASVQTAKGWLGDAADTLRQALRGQSAMTSAAVATIKAGLHNEAEPQP